MHNQLNQHETRKRYGCCLLRVVHLLFPKFANVFALALSYDIALDYLYFFLIYYAFLTSHLSETSARKHRRQSMHYS